VLPRPPKLAYPRTIPIVMEQDMIDALKNLSEKTGRSISEIVREAIREFLIKEGYLKFKKNPVAGGEDPFQVLEERVNLMQLHRLVAYAKSVYDRLKQYKEKDLYYFEDLGKLSKYVNEAKKIAKKLRRPPSNLMKELLELSDIT